ncbi:MAG: hypothetical protein A3H59_03425 [Candidatus Jacksonbacteria bacterium RIFCSPLOWO2_02_FULL_43_9]|nr:MAG: GIY-YIG catalytic domain protein [Parcubacteria group bacterium GW2011_GWA2_43_13]OGY69248.1 MAG: hypothetical protein A3B94_01805 [Candidatus Jacksonbacteria bacterium RIFCSPHIGHO2_02_FULL_43_10]OGY70400.1 MAG: hypothetical protein A2986_00385 [Candidatus Jacksonbacteria bacterium RIFCSPLOWO2_01_FULL_44_13]OGY73707.1 MAG: hypothetical protein A3H59_03425 [Candidatus Jacksonbacteria bacterium RIFCSPLOWO2_02_FULL_43_9]HAZ16594.1 excinuclease ABC subunit C [Candidatus Jacksonbacteria bact
MYYVYILHSTKDNGFYIGSSSDLKNRVHVHNQGMVISTKGRRPLKLVYYEVYILKIDAVVREQFLKTSKGRRQLKHQLHHFLRSIGWEDIPTSNDQESR